MKRRPKHEDFACPCCGFINMDDRLIEILNKLAEHGNFEIVKACRCGYEVPKKSPHYADENTKCIAVHIKVDNCPLRYSLIEKLMEYGVRRIGINHYKGYIHIDLHPKKHPALWGYNEHGVVLG